LGKFMTAGRDDPNTDPGAVLHLTATIVAAYVSKNPVPHADLPVFIRSVHGALSALATGDGGVQANLQKPAIPVKRSVTADYIVCLEDGKRLKMLKRYLRSNYRMTPEEYRAKWGLPLDYPMVAPNYAAKRSEFAKQIGLGRKDAPRRRKRGS
jgi:predicted transcriptional regulator